MVAKSTKAKSKRRPAVKTKAKRGSKPLLARSAEVRKTKPQSSQPVAAAPSAPLVADPLATFSLTGRVVEPTLSFVAVWRSAVRLSMCGESRCDLRNAFSAELRAPGRFLIAPAEFALLSLTLTSGHHAEAQPVVIRSARAV